MKFGKFHKTSWRRQYNSDLCIAATTLLLPFLIYFHLFFDDKAQSIYFLGFQYYHAFPNNQVFVWHFTSNTISFTLLILMFLNSIGRWRLFILPIIGNFFCTMLFGLSISQDYLSFLFSLIGLTALTLIIVLVFIIDSKFKAPLKSELVIPEKLLWSEFFYSHNRKYNSHLRSLIYEKSKLSLKDYVYQIYHLSQLVNGKHYNSPLSGNFNLASRNHFPNIFLGLITLAMTLVLFLDNLISPEKQSVEIAGILITTYGFYDVKTFIWFASQKFVMSLLMILWLLTTRNWWRWAILSPIIFYSYQFWESFQPIEAVDDSGNFNVFPLVFLTILGVIILSMVIRRISVNMDYQIFLKEELNRSIGELSGLKKKTVKR